MVVKPKHIMATVILIIHSLVVMVLICVDGRLSAFSLNKLFLLVGSAMYSCLIISAAPYMTIISISFLSKSLPLLESAPPIPLIPERLLFISILALKALSPRDL